MRPLPECWDVKVVGLTFRPGYPDTLHRLAEVYAAMPKGAQGEATLVRDLDNAHDPNAVAVLAAGAHVGYLPRELAARAASEIDAGAQFRVISANVLVDPDHTDKPGLMIRVQRTNGDHS